MVSDWLLSSWYVSDWHAVILICYHVNSHDGILTVNTKPTFCHHRICQLGRLAQQHHETPTFWHTVTPTSGLCIPSHWYYIILAYLRTVIVTLGHTIMLFHWRKVKLMSWHTDLSTIFATWDPITSRLDIIPTLCHVDLLKFCYID